MLMWLALLLLLLFSLLLRDDFASIEFDEHRPICFELLDRYRQAKVIEEEKLDF